MNYFVCVVVVLFAICLTVNGYSNTIGFNPNSEFVKIFSKCRRGERNFDACMRTALNQVRPYFKYGVPEFNIPSFDPFFAEEVVQRRGGQRINYSLKLKNVYESGWTLSKVTRFKSDLNNGVVKYWQWFPEKYLQGEWELDSNLVVAPFSNKGTFDLSLYNYTQVTTVSKKGRGADNPENPYAVRIEAIDSGDLKLHISNLLGGRAALEQVLDRIINLTWRPGFHMLKPVIDDLVSTAFTKIINDAFREFPFEKIFPR